MTTHHHRFSSLPKLLTAGAVALAVALAVPSEAEAACGSSAATIAADTWTEFHEEAIALGCAVAGPIAGVDFSLCYSSVSDFEDLVLSMLAWWNDMADGGWATIGPRPLEWDELMHGRVYSTDRIFCSTTPSDQAEVDITIEKLDGKAETEVEICKMRKDGGDVIAHTFTFANGDGNIGEIQSRTVTGAKDKIICVHLDNKSVTNTFQYELDADK
jgi:hypothetical protein